MYTKNSMDTTQRKESIIFYLFLFFSCLYSKKTPSCCISPLMCGCGFMEKLKLSCVLIVCCLRMFQLYFGGQCTYQCIPWVLFSISLYSIFSKSLAAFHMNIIDLMINNKWWHLPLKVFKTMKDKTLVISIFLLFSLGCQIALSIESPLIIFQTMIFWFIDLTLSQTTNFRLFQTERVCRWQFWMYWKLQKVFQIGRKLCGKKRNCSMRAISPFPTEFSKDLYCRYVKTRACLGKG